LDHSVKAVFTDIDGTLLNSMHRVTPRTREQVLRIIRKGIPFVIVSARSPSGIYPIMRRNGFSCALISYSGALIMNPDRKVLYSKEIRRETAARIERYFAGKKYDMSWCIYSGDDWIAPDRSDERILKEERIVEARSREGTVDDLPAGAGVNKFLCICAPGTISRIEAEVREAFPETAVVRSSDILLEIMAKGISKREAVLRYCRYLGISPQETVAFGDNYNDVEMLQAAGTGYVMGNAPEEIRAGAAHVTADNDHDGIAQVLEQIIPD
jgi:Cof subfamily protein (haloacid dehalogenase superfamily)